MRWPIQAQLLLPTLSVVVLAILLTSGVSAYFGSRRAREAQGENLRRVVAMLTEAKFPLVESVLRQMGSLSGAEFVLLDRQGKLQAATLQLTTEELTQVRNLPDEEIIDPSGDRITNTLLGRDYLTQHLPVSARDPVTKAGSLVVLYPLDHQAAMMRRAAYPALIAGSVAILAVVLVTTFLANRFVRPIRQLGDQAAAIAQGNFQPVQLSRHDDEIRDLSASIHRMAEQLGQYEEQVRRHEQIRTLNQLSAGMAHQLRNTATGGRMAIELHQRECSTGANSETLDVALQQLRLMESYLQRFMTLSRDNAAIFERLDLKIVVEESLALVRPACAHADIELEYLPPSEPIWVQGDAESLRQLIVNLTMNAVEAAATQPFPPKRIAVVMMTTPNQTILSIHDSGPGPSPAVAERLFEPFVSGKPEGTGLGLYVARQIVENHHGAIHWQREESTTCFTVTLPTL